MRELQVGTREEGREGGNEVQGSTVKSVERK